MRKLIKNWINNSYVYDKVGFIELIVRLVTKNIHEPGFEYLKFINQEALIVDVGANVGQRGRSVNLLIKRNTLEIRFDERM